MIANLMDFCNDCGESTDPDWVFCRACGSALDAPEIQAAPQAVVATDAPKVELISRGWDVVDVDAVDVDAVDVPTDPLADDGISTPLPPGAIEITVDDVTVVEPVAEPVADEPEAAPTAPPTDRWDHLRPHGHIPGVTEASTVPARVAIISVIVVAIGALAAAAIRFYLNIRLDGFSKDTVTARAVRDVEGVANGALVVVAGLAVLSALTLLWWLARSSDRSRFRPGPIEAIAALAGLAGIALIVVFTVLEQESVVAAIAANSLVVLGLGLVVAACVAVAKSVTRIEFPPRF